MRLDQEVRHKSEDIDDDVLNDVIKAIRRRIRSVIGATTFLTSRAIAAMAIPFSSTGICHVVSVGS
jgi:hypothetical protein